MRALSAAHRGSRFSGPLLAALLAGALGACSEPRGPTPHNAALHNAALHNAAPHNAAPQDAAATATPVTPPKTAGYVPPDPSEIPKGPEGDAIRRGLAIVLDPQKHAAQHVGGDLKCAHCHQDAGRKAGAAPLWAAWVHYPAYRKKNNKINSMEERIQGCFRYSMNALAAPAGLPPVDAQVITDISAYARWLARDAAHGEGVADLPGRGFPAIDPPGEAPSVARGEAVFTAKCVACHQADGQGIKRGDVITFPPLWGPRAYNWGAGMHQLDKAARFIRANMPLNLGYTLTAQEAWDVAAFINSHPRPKDPRQAGTVAENAEAHHQHNCSYAAHGGDPLSSVGADH